MPCAHLQVLCFIILICAAVVSNAINDVIDAAEDEDIDDGEYNNSGSYRSAAGWLIFVSIMGMLIEMAIIVIRILNVSFINQNFFIFGLIVSIVLCVQFNILMCH